MSTVNNRRHSSQNLSHIRLGNTPSVARLSEAERIPLREALNHLKDASAATSSRDKAVLEAGNALVKIKRFLLSNNA